MSTDRIRWEDDGYGGFLGYAGTLDERAFQLWVRTFSDEWTLTSALTGQGAGAAQGYASDPAELKARAEELLAEFAASLGAVFPDAAEAGSAVPLMTYEPRPAAEARVMTGPGIAGIPADKGHCPVCGRVFARTWTGNGTLHVHGPLNRRCPGSGMQPVPPAIAASRAAGSKQGVITS